MSHKPRTSLEFNLFHIERTLKKLERREMAMVDVAKKMNKRFETLKGQSLVWHEDLYPKYIALAKKLNDI